MTGLTSNPTIFNHAIKNSTAYDAAIPPRSAKASPGRTLFFELAIDDITRAADLFRPTSNRPAAWTAGSRWRSRPCWPTTPQHAGRGQGTARQRRTPNLFIKIPGTPEGLPAIEEAIFAGVRSMSRCCFPAIITWRRPRPISAASSGGSQAGLRPDVGSVASLFISRWDTAVKDKVPEPLQNQLGIAIGKRAYRAYLGLMAEPRWQRIFNAGARPQRLLMASTGTKDPKASDILYVKGLAAPLTVDTMPEATLKAFADHGEVGPAISADGGDCEAVLAQFAKAGVDIDALAARLQDEGAASFVKSWNELMEVIASKSALLKKAG